MLLLFCKNISFIGQANYKTKNQCPKKLFSLLILFKRTKMTVINLWLQTYIKFFIDVNKTMPLNR
ncbi:hypothetical protein A3F06_00125 [candidate division TM6 bacterium RIFCSPHIGHO2_12_FULL_36_22]|nr:MAG: hypothetical protein A3F06_00125 [candidate division TM6 bacterium RIFCSPHIGHO2_12_FULL_36_22]